jgi:hypothetical protein
MKRIIIFLTAVFLITVQLPLFSQNRDERPVIQLALLLDTSNSMDGLINQAKSQLWKIVSETGRVKRNGLKPVLQVALYEYGNDSLSMLSGYIRKVVPFTTDLDYLSHNLFQLTTNGGSEYCGQVIMEAGRKLDWDRNPDTLKLVFIAGNEPFNQGSYSYVKSCKTAFNKEITVNTIFCGDYQEGISTNWLHGAHLGGGKYMNINSDYEEVYYEAPQDLMIEDLNRKLNKTYLGYGKMGMEKKEMQAAQDSNASGLSMGSFLERAKVKSSSSYSNSSWDIVDAYTEGEVELEDVPAAELPPEMAGMDDEEKKEYVENIRSERKQIQEEISKLSLERDEYIKEQKAKADEETTLDSAIIDAVRDAATGKGFILE